MAVWMAVWAEAAKARHAAAAARTAEVRVGARRGRRVIGIEIENSGDVSKMIQGESVAAADYDWGSEKR
jgi:hypothetical protein